MIIDFPDPHPKPTAALTPEQEAIALLSGIVDLQQRQLSMALNLLDDVCAVASESALAMRNLESELRALRRGLQG